MNVEFCLMFLSHLLTSNGNNSDSTQIISQIYDNLVRKHNNVKDIYKICLENKSLLINKNLKEKYKDFRDLYMYIVTIMDIYTNSKYILDKMQEYFYEIVHFSYLATAVQNKNLDDIIMKFYLNEFLTYQFSQCIKKNYKKHRQIYVNYFLYMQYNSTTIKLYKKKYNIYQKDDKISFTTISKSLESLVNDHNSDQFNQTIKEFMHKVDNNKVNIIKMIDLCIYYFEFDNKNIEKIDVKHRNELLLYKNIYKKIIGENKEHDWIKIKKNFLKINDFFIKKKYFDTLRTLQKFLFKVNNALFFFHKNQKIIIKLDKICKDENVNFLHSFIEEYDEIIISQCLMLTNGKTDFDKIIDLIKKIKNIHAQLLILIEQEFDITKK